MSTALQREPSTARGGHAGERWLLALAAAVLVGIYVLGKTWPRLTFNPVGSGWFGDTFVFAVAAGLMGLMLLGPARTRTTPRRRLALVALRLAVVLLVLLVMLRPALVYTAVSRLPATIVILVDTSGSMKAADDVGHSRYERLREVLRQAESDLADLAQQVTIKAYAFDADLKELTFSGGRVELPDSAEGEQTALGWAISEIVKREAPHRLVGVVLLSDANQRALVPRNDDPATVAARMKGRNQPVFGVLFGPGEAQVVQQDLVLESLRANDSVHMKNRLAITAEARVKGYPDPQMEAQLLVEKDGEMKVAERMQFRPREDGQITPFDLGHVFDSPGLYKLTVRLPPRDGEFDTANNEQSTIIRVTEGGLAVLYLEGAVRLESRNILRALGSAENTRVDFVRLDAQHPDRRPAAANQTLTEGLQPGKYDVFILGDLAASAFLPAKGGQPSELDLLRQRVQQGSGLMMLGGLHSFGPGGYAGTPIEDLLPVRMSPTDFQDFGAKLRENKHLLGHVKLQPAPQAAGNFLTLLTAPEKNAALWASLPPLANGANRLENNGGVVLLEGRLVDDAGRPRDQEVHPILIAKTGIGGGRSLAFAGDSTWRWASHGQQSEEAHKRFWRQLALWLAGKDQGEKRPVWVLADERNVFANQSVNLSAGARGADGQPLADFELEAEVVRRDDRFQELATEKLAFNRQADKRTAAFKPTQPGDYLIRVRAVQAGKELGKAEERFLVREPRQLEMQNPVSDWATMQKIAKETGGLAVSPGEFDKVLEGLRKQARALEDEVRTVSSLWDPLRVGPLARFGLGISLAALCGYAVALLLGLEWFLRKRWGLV
jgi:uncharacterized membrane protein